MSKSTFSLTSQPADMDEGATSGSTSYLTFFASGRLFAVPVLDIREVTMEPPPTRIPHAPDAVLGYVSIRGTICLSIDFAKLVSLEPSRLAMRQLIIFKSHVAPMMGIAVDATGEIIHLDSNDRESYLQRHTAELGPERILVQTGRSKEQLVIIIDPTQILHTIENHLRAS